MVEVSEPRALPGDDERYRFFGEIEEHFDSWYGPDQATSRVIQLRLRVTEDELNSFVKRFHHGNTRPVKRPGLYEVDVSARFDEALLDQGVVVVSPLTNARRTAVSIPLESVLAARVGQYESVEAPQFDLESTSQAV